MRKLFLAVSFLLIPLLTGCSSDWILKLVSEEQKPATTIETYDSIKSGINAEKATTELKDAINIKLPQKNRTEIQKGDSFLWITKDGLSVKAQNTFLLTYKIYLGDQGVSGELVEVVKQPQNQIIMGEFLEVMKKLKFNKNVKNSSANPSDDKFYSYIKAYENDKTVCLIEIRPDYFSDSEDSKSRYQTEIKCISKENLEQAYNEQAPILRDLGLTNGESFITIVRQYGDFINLNVNFRVTGYFTLAKKENGHYKGIFSGQDSPECSVLRDNNVPAEFYNDCYEPENEQKITTPSFSNQPYYIDDPYYNCNIRQGCCSHHGGVSYCDHSLGRAVCNDGTYSPSC